MKAFIAMHGLNTWNRGCLLVFAESAQQAKSFAYYNGHLGEYVDIRVRRRPEYDGLFENRVIFYNRELPEGVVFY